MFQRSHAVAVAVAGLLASCGLAMADTTGISAPALSLEPTVVTAQDASAPSGLIMQGLDKIGAAKPLQNLGINIYGWVEAGYTTNLRNNQGSQPTNTVSTRTGAFTQEIGNHFNLNQIDLRIEKIVDSKKFDVGGLVEWVFGTDSNFIHSNGIELQTPGDNPGEVPQLDITQAYVDVNIPVGNGLKVRAGKFATLLGTETIDPRGNAFYTHSYLFASIPYTQTGVIAFYSLNDQWSVAGGITRGWDHATEDTNGSPDFLGQVTYTPNKQWSFIMNISVGPQDAADTGHYRTVINPLAVWQVTDKLKLNAEGLYVYDGNVNSEDATNIHAYGDDYGFALYGSYAVCDYVTANARVEWEHTYNDVFPIAETSDLTPNDIPATVNVWALTLGLAIKPLPKDPIGQNLTIRPEIRYDFSEDHLFQVGNGSSVFRDSWTAGADVIFTF